MTGTMSAHGNEAPTGAMLLQLVGSSPLEPSRTELNAQPQAAQHMVRAAAAAANELAGREKKVSEESEVTMAVRCLQAAIEADPRDFRARTLLAALLMKYTRNTIEAEEHLTRALGAARALDLAEATYAIIFYQCQLYAQTRGFKAAEKKLRDTMAELKGVGQYDWYYRFALALVDLRGTTEGEERRCLNLVHTVCSEAERNGHSAIQALLLLSAAKMALQVRDFEGARSSFQKCVSLFRGEESEAMDVDGGEAAAKPDPLAAPPWNAPGAAVRDPEIRLYLSVLLSLYLLRIGRVDLANGWLCGNDGLEKYLDAEQTGERTVEPSVQRGIFDLPIPATNPPQSLQLSLLPRTRILCLAWLALGLVRKPSNPSNAKAFFVEGLNRVDAVLRDLGNDRHFDEPADVRTEWEWLINCKVFLLVNLCDVLMIRGELRDAQAYMTMFGNILVRNEKLMDKWKQTFFLSWGLLRQGLGEMEEALNWLEGAADPAAKDEDIRMIALLNMCMIYLGPAFENRERAITICEYLKRHSAECTSDAFPAPQAAALQIIEGLNFLKQGHLIKARASLTEALRKAESSQAGQIKTMTLGILGSLYIGSDPNKAEAMLTMATGVAARTKSDLMAVGTINALRDVFLRSNRPGEAEKVTKQIEKHRTAYEKKSGL